MKTLLHTSSRILRSNQAFTLVEICVAMGIMAVLMLALAQYSLSVARAQKSQSLSNEFTDLTALVGQILGDETLCTSTMTGQVPTTNGAFAGPFNVTPPGGVVQTVFTPTLQPSGLNISPVTFGNVTLGAVSGIYTEKTVEVIISATKGPTVPVSTVNTYFVGNSILTKTYTIGVWTVTATSAVYKCIASRDMGRGTPVAAAAFAPPAIPCTGAAPACGAGTATCCVSSLSPVPYWECPTIDWTCPP